MNYSTSVNKVTTICGLVYLLLFVDVVLTNSDCCDYHETIWNKTVMDLEEILNISSITSPVPDQNEDEFVRRDFDHGYLTELNTSSASTEELYNVTGPFLPYLMNNFSYSNSTSTAEVSIKNELVSKVNFYWQKMLTPTSTEPVSNFFGWQHQEQMATPTEDYVTSQKQNQMPNSTEKLVFSPANQSRVNKNINTTKDILNHTTMMTKSTTGYDHAKDFIAKFNISTSPSKSYFNHYKKRNKVIESLLGGVIGDGELRHGDVPHHVYLYKMVLAYRAFCGGSIITVTRVLTSTNCLLTNQKHVRPGLKGGLQSVHVVAGVLETNIQYPNHTYQQWRKIYKLYSQEFYRHPQYSLTILEVDRRWHFNDVVNRIPFASRDYDFDGVCNAVAVKTSKSWTKFKQLHLAELKMITRHDCQLIFLRSTRVFFCTAYDYDFVLYSVIPGGGLICQKTGDPLEVNEKQGILVAVTVQNQYHMPTLHQKVGMFYQWVVDTAHASSSPWIMLCVVFVVLHYV